MKGSGSGSVIHLFTLSSGVSPEEYLSMSCFPADGVCVVGAISIGWVSGPVILHYHPLPCGLTPPSISQSPLHIPFLPPFLIRPLLTPLIGETINNHGPLSHH